MEPERTQVTLKIKKLSDGQIKYKRVPLDIDSLADIESRVGKRENGYMILSYKIRDY